MTRLDQIKLRMLAKYALMLGCFLVLFAFALIFVPGGQGEVFIFIFGTQLILNIGGQYYVRELMNAPFKDGQA